MAAAGMTPRSPEFAQLRDEAYADIEAGKLAARSLVIWGELDPQVPLGLGEQFQDMLIQNGVRSELQIMEGLGHAPFIERPAEFDQLVIDACLGD